MWRQTQASGSADVDVRKELGAFSMKGHAEVAQASTRGNIERHRGQAPLQRLAERDVVEGIAVGRRDGDCGQAVERGVHEIEVSLWTAPCIGMGDADGWNDEHAAKRKSEQGNKGGCAGRTHEGAPAGMRCRRWLARTRSAASSGRIGGALRKRFGTNRRGAVANRSGDVVLLFSAVICA